jgi:glycosyltransferase involved in cell wall biosynthesis
MKILHVTPSVSRAYGGPTASLLGYSLAGRLGGAEVVVAAPELPGQGSAWFAERAKDAGVEVRTFAGRGRGAFITSSALRRWLRREAEGCDLVHVHGLLNPVSSLAARSCRLRGVPMVIRPFGMLSRYTFTHRRGWAKKLVFQALDRANVQSAGAMHFTTRSEMEQAMWHGIALQERGFVVPPPLIGVDGSARTRHDAAVSAPLVLFLSRLHPVKSVELLLAAWDSVAARHPTARLVIAGDGEPGYVAHLEAQARQSRAADRIEFVGFADDRRKQSLLADASVFVLPSQHENFGVAVLEAVAAGLPAVVTREVQLSSLIEDQGLGVIAERSPEALANAVSDVLSSADLRRHCSENGPRIVEDLFSLASVSSQLMSMYEHVLAHSN